MVDKVGRIIRKVFRLYASRGDWRKRAYALYRFTYTGEPFTYLVATSAGTLIYPSKRYIGEYSGVGHEFEELWEYNNDRWWVLGSLHGHPPGMSCIPSSTDIRTGTGMVAALDRPFYLCIYNGRDVRAWEFHRYSRQPDGFITYSEMPFKALNFSMNFFIDAETDFPALHMMYLSERFYG